MSYRITVKPIKGAEYLIYKGVVGYTTEEGYLVFTDVRTSKVKRFAISNTELEEEDE